MPVSVQRDAALIALGLEPGNVEFHHQPILETRPYVDDEDGRRHYSPAANDPRHIIPMAREAHRARTPADISTVAKVKRIDKKEARHRAIMAAKDSLEDKPRDVKRHRIHGRGFDKTRRRKVNGKVEQRA